MNTFIVDSVKAERFESVEQKSISDFINATVYTKNYYLKKLASFVPQEFSCWANVGYMPGLFSLSISRFTIATIIDLL